MRADYLECAKIINTHGVDGAVKLECWCDSPEVLCSLERMYIKRGGETVALKVLRASVFKQFVLARFEGIGDIDAAEALRGQILFAAREDIAIGEGDHFIADLLGLPLIHADSGEKLGVLTNVINAGASDIYVIQTDRGEKMMPAVAEFVDRIDLDAGIFVRPIEGMLD